MKKARLFLAVLLLPVAASFTWNIFKLIIKLGESPAHTVLPLWAGVVGYIFFQYIFFRPVRTYVFGHELTHAIAGILSGAKLKGFKVSSRGGSVTLTKSSVWITLAPYFIPLYTILLIVLYKVAGRFVPLGAYYPYFLFFVGFTLSFHFGLTNYAVAQGQSDLKRFGRVFSGIFIIVVTAVVLSGILKAVFPDRVNLRGFIYKSLKDSVGICIFLKTSARELWLSFRKTS